MLMLSDNTQSRPAKRFKELYDHSFDQVYGYIFARTGDAGTAEEIIQETYTAAWVSMGSFSGRSRDITWVIGIARHKIADYYRKAMRRETFEEAIEEYQQPDAGIETMIIGYETRMDVARAFSALCPAYRYVLAMKYLDGYSVKEIAHALERTPKAIDGMLQRAKAGFLKGYKAITEEADHGTKTV